MRVSLAQVTPAHAPLVREWLSAPGHAEYFRTWSPSTAHLSDEALAQALVHTKLILLGGRPSGLLSIFNIDVRNRRAEIGAMVEEGIVAKRSVVVIEAIKQTCSWLFNHEGLNKVTCNVLPHRADLKHLLSKFTFKEEGLLREHIYFDGRFHDEIIMSLTRTDYDKLESK